MKDGLLPIVAVAGVVSVALLWSVSAQDPYWRLFESAEAPVFEQNEEPSETFTVAPLEFGNADSGSRSPSSELSTGPARPYELSGTSPQMSGEAGGAVNSAPAITSSTPTESRPLSDPGINLNVAYGLPRVDTPARVDLVPAVISTDANSPEFIVAFAPVSLPVPIALRDRDNGAIAVAASGNPLAPFVAPSAPSQPRIAASKGTEEALALKRSQRMDVQRRLALAGFNPRGIDGVFGPRTRNAIADFQTAWGFPATGYLEPSLVADLTSRTEDAYRAWRHQVAAASRTAPEIAPNARERQLADAGDEGKCVRDAEGRIVARQSLACDLAGFGENFISLGRSTYNDEDAETGEVLSGASR